MAQKILRYDSRDIIMTVALSEREINLAHKVIHIRVPSGAQASVRFGSSDRPSIPLQTGWQRFCLPQSPGVMFLTAAAGSPIRIFTSEEIVADFFSEAAASGAIEEDAATRTDVIWRPGGDENVQINQGVSTQWFGRGWQRMSFPGWSTNVGIVHQFFNTSTSARIPPVNVAVQHFSAGAFRFSITPILRETGLITGYDDDWYTVTRFICSIAREAQTNGLLSTDGGIHYQGGNSVTDWNPAQNAPLFGLFGNGAGWQWGSRVAASGVFDELVPLTWPGSVNDYATFEIRVTSATPLRAAVIQLYANRSLLIERDFAVNAATLPSYATTLLAFVCGMAGGIGGAAGSTEEDFLHVRWARFIATRHTPA